MFYSQFILAKKGPLGTIWIAAHLERKLRKNQVADTDIGVSVDSILFPDVPIALRLSSHLLLGVVRIYSRKVNYLFDDCSEALLKVKQAFRSAAVDLPPEESTAPYHSITLPETFDLDDFELPDNDIFQGNYVDHHVSTRDQITLQDKMDGVVYTASQFGLDERFGDGDASQIGFDLDEVLLGDKAATMDHDDLSASPEVSHKKDDNNEELRGTSDRVQVEDSGSKIDLIDGEGEYAQASEYAQGPSTPGLQEPNLFGTQVDQVNDEADCHNSADLVSMKTEQNESSAHPMENDVVDCSVQNNGKHISVDLHHGDSDCIMVEVDSKREEEEHLASTIVTKDQENFIPDDHCLTLAPLMDSSNKDHPITISPESAGGMIDSSNMPEKVEDLHDRVLMNDEPIVLPLGHHVNVVPEGLSVNETVASPSNSQAKCDQENISFKMLANVDGSRGLESDGHLEDDNTLSKHEVLNDTEISKSEGQPCPVEEAQVSNVTSPLGSPGRPEVVDVEAQASQKLKEIETLNHVSLEAEEPTESYLRPCTNHQSQPSLSPIEGEKCHETDVSNAPLGYHETVDPSVPKEKPDLRESVTLFGSIGKSAASDMPEPEKMLSLAYQRDGEANDLLLESTPVNQGMSEGHADAATSTYISGRKRSFTESTLTMQSVDLVESYGGSQSKRTRESIPDDDDLLSSILAGRGSSVMKIKPSPAAPEIASTKRFRSGSRTSAIKRKVLMDDVMVLHGDTIRQQLTSTEDIRRIRKKAPCTRHEILMIQRQFLEDEIFHEPIFTDLSANLTVLRNGTFDLTGIKVCDSGLDSSCIEKTNDQESYSRTNNEIHGAELETNNEPMAVQHQENTAAQPTEIHILTESHQSEVNMAYHDIDAHEHPNIISQAKDLDSSQNAEMNNAGGNIEVSEADKCSVAPGIESSAQTEIFENDLCVPNDFVATLPLMNETNDLVDSIHTKALSEPTAQNMNASPNPEDEFVKDHRDRSEVGDIEIAEPAMEIRTQVLTDGVEANDLCPSVAPGSVEIAEHAMEITTEVLTDGVDANELCPSPAPGSKETDEHADNQASFNGDLPIEESGNFMLRGINEDQIVSSGLGCDKDAKSDYIFSENTEVDCLHSVAHDLDENKSSLNVEENPICQDAALQSTMCPEVSAIQSPFVDQKEEDDMVANDTGFLNVGDDEIIEDDDDADDFMPSAEGTHLENSGWSSRTRAVAKYLQTSFNKEGLHGRQNLQLDNILAGKTRKEASRMFFETLVLKTRDYVHVEQAEPYDNITLKPRTKLMKADF